MSTVIEAKRLNGTDLGKTIEYAGISGTLIAVNHRTEFSDETRICDQENHIVSIPVVYANVDGTTFPLHQATKVTITGKETPPDEQAH